MVIFGLSNSFSTKLRSMAHSVNARACVLAFAALCVAFSVPLDADASETFSINIAARDPGTDTHRNLIPQDKVTIHISGVWSVWGANDPRSSGAEGIGVTANNRKCDGEGGWICNNMSWGTTTRKYPMPGANEGALVILIGGHPKKVVIAAERASAKPNPVTKTFDYVVSFSGQSGVLGFAPNDDDVGDNRGSMVATVTIDGPDVPVTPPPPHPTSNCSVPTWTGGCAVANEMHAERPGCAVACENGSKALCRPAGCTPTRLRNSLCWCSPPGPSTISGVPDSD